MIDKATSSGLILTPGPAGNWDDERVSGPCVLRASDGCWRMWYYGRDVTFDREINLPTGRIGLAVSENGVHWERIAGPSGRGAVLEAHQDPERFDSTHVGVSCVHHFDGLYWMWYFGGDRSRFRVADFNIKGLQLRPGCAVSRDGLRWQRLEGPCRGAVLDLGPPGAFDMATCGWPQVVRVQDDRW